MNRFSSKSLLIVAIYFLQIETMSFSIKVIFVQIFRSALEYVDKIISTIKVRLEK
jgi:hypothetical protein